eukprot:6205664-Pleurochrysis_carterae.AAC.2
MSECRPLCWTSRGCLGQRTRALEPSCPCTSLCLQPGSRSRKRDRPSHIWLFLQQETLLKRGDHASPSGLEVAVHLLHSFQKVPRLVDLRQKLLRQRLRRNRQGARRLGSREKRHSSGQRGVYGHSAGDAKAPALMCILAQVASAVSQKIRQNQTIVEAYYKRNTGSRALALFGSATTGPHRHKRRSPC